MGTGVCSNSKIAYRLKLVSECHVERVLIAGATSYSTDLPR